METNQPKHTPDNYDHVLQGKNHEKGWPPHFPPEVVEQLNVVERYSGTGTWFVAGSKDVIAIVLINDQGNRRYIAAKEFYQAADYQ